MSNTEKKIATKKISDLTPTDTITSDDLLYVSKKAGDKYTSNCISFSNATQTMTVESLTVTDTLNASNTTNATFNNIEVKGEIKSEKITVTKEIVVKENASLYNDNLGTEEKCKQRADSVPSNEVITRAYFDYRMGIYEKEQSTVTYDCYIAPEGSDVAYDKTKPKEKYGNGSKEHPYKTLPRAIQYFNTIRLGVTGATFRCICYAGDYETYYCKIRHPDCTTETGNSIKIMPYVNSAGKSLRASYDSKTNKVTEYATTDSADLSAQVNFVTTLQPTGIDNVYGTQMLVQCYTMMSNINLINYVNLGLNTNCDIKAELTTLKNSNIWHTLAGTTLSYIDNDSTHYYAFSTRDLTLNYGTDYSLNTLLNTTSEAQALKSMLLKDRNNSYICQHVVNARRIDGEGTAWKQATAYIGIDVRSGGHIELYGNILIAGFGQNSIALIYDNATMWISGDAKVILTTYETVKINGKSIPIGLYDYISNAMSIQRASTAIVASYGGAYPATGIYNYELTIKYFDVVFSFDSSTGPWRLNHLNAESYNSQIAQRVVAAKCEINIQHCTHIYNHNNGTLKNPTRFSYPFLERFCKLNAVVDVNGTNKNLSAVSNATSVTIYYGTGSSKTYGVNTIVNCLSVVGTKQDHSPATTLNIFSDSGKSMTDGIYLEQNHLYRATCDNSLSDYANYSQDKFAGVVLSICDVQSIGYTYNELTSRTNK